MVTEHDSVYAFDPDSGTLLWQKFMLGSGKITSDNRNCYQVVPEIGITSTPVIDRSRSDLTVRSRKRPQQSWSNAVAGYLRPVGGAGGGALIGGLAGGGKGALIGAAIGAGAGTAGAAYTGNELPCAQRPLELQSRRTPDPKDVE